MDINDSDPRNDNPSNPGDQGEREMSARETAHPRRIRATHPYSFRSGEWATIVGRTDIRGRDCYAVRFDDGMSDFWVAGDPVAGYEFDLAAIDAAVTGKAVRATKELTRTGGDASEMRPDEIEVLIFYGCAAWQDGRLLLTPEWGQSWTRWESQG
jgi:hypothetical protein